MNKQTNQQTRPITIHPGGGNSNNNNNNNMMSTNDVRTMMWRVLCAFKVRGLTTLMAFRLFNIVASL